MNYSQQHTPLLLWFRRYDLEIMFRLCFPGTVAVVSLMVGGVVEREMGVANLIPSLANETLALDGTLSEDDYAAAKIKIATSIAFIAGIAQV